MRKSAARHLGVMAASAALALCLTPSAASAVSFSGPTNYTTGTFTRSVAVADFNGDSDPDLAVAKATPGAPGVSILTGATGGTFVAGGFINTGGDPRRVATADFNGDSDPDLVVVRGTANDVSVLLGAAGATFTGPVNFPTGGSTPHAVAIGDFNGDTDPDLAVANVDSDEISILLGAAGGTFTVATEYVAGDGPSSIAVADFNDDLDPDLAVANNITNPNVMIFVGGAGGTFTGPTGTYTGNVGGLAAGDFDGDSDPDLVVANTAERQLMVLQGATGATFAVQPAFTCTCRATWFAVTDFNGDSDLDLAVSDFDTSRVWVLTGSSGTTFTAATPFPVASTNSAVAVGDFDGDSNLDLVTANSFTDTISVLLAVPPTISVTNDVAHVEGNSGPTAYSFNVSLNAPSTDPVSVDYHTEDGTATGPPDYFAASGTLDFTPGETTKVVTVYSNGDTSFEPDEDFRMVITNPMFATITDDTGVGTIQNDDQAGYARPKAANPSRFSLVVAYQKCNASNRVHGPPLEHTSCNPPVPLSQYLTVGTPDANGQAANATGSVRYRVINGIPSTPADEADVALNVDISDVRGKVTLGDYIAELWATVPVRVTDRLADQQTVTDFQFGFAVPCSATTDATVGSTCSVSTTADAVLPGAVVEAKRTIWQLGQIQVQDGGDDGEGATTTDNTPFLKQGFFVP